MSLPVKATIGRPPGRDGGGGGVNSPVLPEKNYLLRGRFEKEFLVCHPVNLVVILRIKTVILREVVTGSRLALF